MSNQWNLKKEKYSCEIKYLPSISVSSHPLTSNVKIQKSVKNPEKRVPRPQFIDPLSIALDGADPLMGGPTDNNSSSHSNLHINEDLSLSSKTFKSWDEVCSQHLSKCTTNQRLSLAANFPLNSELGIPNFETLGYNKIKGSTKTESERLRLRLDYLAALEDSKSSKDLTSLTPEQFSQYISYLKSELLNVWHSEHRVKALKIAKELAKSLCLTSPELYYPHKFMLVTNLLSTLGRLVYQRIEDISKVQSSTNRTEAKEIARDWFSNISSVKDLLPRIYLEATLLQCYAFTDIDTVELAFERLLKMTRGLADPLASAYAKMYIAKVGQRGNQLTLAIYDIKDVLRWGWSEQGIEAIDVGSEACSSGKEIAEKVFYPPLFWLMQCLVAYCPINTYQMVFEICSKSDKLVQYLLLKAMLSAFPASYVASECISFADLLSQSLHSGSSPENLLICYGKIINLAPPPKERKFELLSAVWNLLCTLDSLHTFIKACDPWMQFAVHSFEENDTDKILSNLVKKIKLLSSEQPKSYHSDLLRLVVNILRNASQPEVILLRPNLQQLLIMLQREVVATVGVVGRVGKTRLDLSDLKTLVEAIIARHSSPFTDAALIKILIDLFSSLHDRINALTTNDEKRQIAQLVRDFILKVDFGKDFTQQLEFYVSCRASFVSLDSILEILIHQVCKLQMETLSIVKRKHNSKTASFERACTAYVFITIPSIASSRKRLQLYLLAGSVAIVNSCVNQAQTCIESAVREVSKLTEEYLASGRTNPTLSDLISTICCLCSHLIAIPCLSDEPFSWFVRVRDAVSGATTDGADLGTKVNFAVFKAVCASSRKSLPYHFSGVIANDAIFSLDRRHLEAVDLCHQQLSDILTSVTSQKFDGLESLKIDLLECLLQYGDCEDNTRILSLIFKSLSRESDIIYYKNKIKTMLQL